MKHTRKIFLGSLILAGLQFGLSSCVSDDGPGVYYGEHRDPWFHDDRWMDGQRWHQQPGTVDVGVYIHPPRGRR